MDQETECEKTPETTSFPNWETEANIESSHPNQEFGNLKTVGF